MRQKYGNHKIKNAYGTYDSQLEYARFIFLSNREKEGEITNLRRQVEYLLIPAQYGTEIKHLKTKDKEVRVLLERSCSYIADFKIKKKLMLWVHQIQVKIISSPTFWEK